MIFSIKNTLFCQTHISTYINTKYQLYKPHQKPKFSIKTPPLEKITPSKQPGISMALVTSPLIKSKPFSPLPPRHKKTPTSSFLTFNFGKFKPRTNLYQIKTNYKQKNSCFCVLSNDDNRNGRIVGTGGDNYGRILLSDVIVKRKRNVFWGRKWNSMDIGTAGVVLLMHLLSLFAPFCFNWSAFWVAFGLYVVTGLLGITLSFHRNLSHRSFRLPKWLEYTFAYCGVLALQGNPIDWVSTHRHHHQFCDSERDPHSPIEGFWFSHMSWLFDTDSVAERCGGASNVGDLEKQPFYQFIQKTYILHPLALAVLLYAAGGFPFLVWGVGVRSIWVYHITWLVNSACHVWGKQTWNTGDLSRNNWWVAVLAFGEGWHNNHHAFEFSARHGLEWWQFDMTWYVVSFLQAIGLATDVKVPSEVQKKRMAFNTS